VIDEATSGAIGEKSSLRGFWAERRAPDMK